MQVWRIYCLLIRMVKAINKETITCSFSWGCFSRKVSFHNFGLLDYKLISLFEDLLIERCLLNYHSLFSILLIVGIQRCAIQAPEWRCIIGHCDVLFGGSRIGWHGLCKAMEDVSWCGLSGRSWTLDDYKHKFVKVKREGYLTTPLPNYQRLCTFHGLYHPCTGACAFELTDVWLSK